MNGMLKMEDAEGRMVLSAMPVSFRIMTGGGG